jgi:hypothetical protein
MQPSPMEGVEFNLVNDKGFEKWHNKDGFGKEIIWADK